MLERRQAKTVPGVRFEKLAPRAAIARVVRAKRLASLKPISCASCPSGTLTTPLRCCRTPPPRYTFSHLFAGTSRVCSPLILRFISVREAGLFSACIAYLASQSLIISPSRPRQTTRGLGPAFGVQHHHPPRATVSASTLPVIHHSLYISNNPSIKTSTCDHIAARPSSLPASWPPLSSCEAVPSANVTSREDRKIAISDTHPHSFDIHTTAAGADGGV